LGAATYHYPLIHESADRVNVLGLVCKKMAEQVVLARQDEEDSRETQEVSIITQDDAVVEQDMEDDDDVQY
jgi:hypothetical protein